MIATHDTPQVGDEIVWLYDLSVVQMKGSKGIFKLQVVCYLKKKAWLFDGEQGRRDC